MFRNIFLTFISTLITTPIILILIHYFGFKETIVVLVSSLIAKDFKKYVFDSLTMYRV